MTSKSGDFTSNQVKIKYRFGTELEINFYMYVFVELFTKDHIQQNFYQLIRTHTEKQFAEYETNDNNSVLYQRAHKN